MCVCTYKTGFQVPAPAVVEEAHDDGSSKVSDQNGEVRDLNVRHGQLHELLRHMDTQMTSLFSEHRLIGIIESVGCVTI